MAPFSSRLLCTHRRAPRVWHGRSRLSGTFGLLLPSRRLGGDVGPRWNGSHRVYDGAMGSRSLRHLCEQYAWRGDRSTRSGVLADSRFDYAHDGVSSCST